MIDITLLHARGIDFIEAYKSEQWGLSNELSLFIKQDEFVQHFTIEAIKRMSLFDYCLGTNNHESFSYLLEYGLRWLGSIKGGYAFKHGIFYKKGDYKKNKVTFDKRFGKTEREAFEEIKKQIIFIVDCANKNDLESVQKSKLWYLVKYKIYFTYNPSGDIPIFKKDHVQKIYKELGLSRNKLYNKEFGIRKAIFDFKNSDPVFSMMTNLEFMSFLYSDYSGFDLKNDKEAEEEISNDSESKKIKHSFEGVIDEYENYDPLSFISKDVDTFKIGSKGEEIVEEYLSNNHCLFEIDLSKGIIAICRDPNRYKDCHCDFMYFTNKGVAKFVEAKATSQNTPNSIQFAMSRYEYDFMLKNKDNFFICYVNNVFNDNYVQIIEPDVAIDILKPSKYEASINVKKIRKIN